MSDHGYTATEALTALAILGLAISGLTGGLKVIGQGQMATGAKISEAAGIRTASNELAMLLDRQGPFRSDVPGAFAGNAQQFSFPCGSGACSAKLTKVGLTLTRGDGPAHAVALKNAGDLKFEYVGSQSQVGAWPPPPPPLPAPQWQVLQAVVLRDGVTHDTLAAARIAVQQAADCEYDSIIQDCRNAGS